MIMNKKFHFSRRQVLTFASVSIMASFPSAFAERGIIDIHVVKNAQCGCCDSWVEILSQKGFMVTTENRSQDLLTKFKIKSGVPKAMRSCHTAHTMGYFIEGHVPTEDIKRLIAERPNALGLAVPGMPFGSPGMGPEAERQAYNVFIIRRNRTPEVFHHYPKAGLLV